MITKSGIKLQFLMSEKDLRSLSEAVSRENNRQLSPELRPNDRESIDGGKIFYDSKECQESLKT